MNAKEDAFHERHNELVAAEEAAAELTREAKEAARDAEEAEARLQQLTTELRASEDRVDAAHALKARCPPLARRVGAFEVFFKTDASAFNIWQQCNNVFCVVAPAWSAGPFTPDLERPLPGAQEDFWRQAKYHGEEGDKISDRHFVKLSEGFSGGRQRQRRCLVS